MAKRVRCPCGDSPECQLCHGTKYYEYQPGPRGWLPFRCPTCGGTGQLAGPGPEGRPCVTCRGERKVDPADPPYRGVWDLLCKIFFGA